MLVPLTIIPQSRRISSRVVPFLNEVLLEELAMKMTFSFGSNGGLVMVPLSIVSLRKFGKTYLIGGLTS